MSAAKDLARKRKNYTMGDYNPTKEEDIARLWCIRNNIKISPACVGPRQWKIDIQEGFGAIHRSPKVFGPTEIWEVINSYYIHYHDKKTKKER